MNIFSSARNTQNTAGIGVRRIIRCIYRTDKQATIHSQRPGLSTGVFNTYNTAHVGVITAAISRYGSDCNYVLYNRSTVVVYMSYDQTNATNTTTHLASGYFTGYENVVDCAVTVYRTDQKTCCDTTLLLNGKVSLTDLQILNCRVVQATKQTNVVRCGLGNVQPENRVELTVKVTPESSFKTTIIGAYTDWRPFDAAKIDVVHQQEIIAAVRITAVNTVREISQLGTRVDQVRIVLGAATAAKAIGNGAVPKIRLGSLDVLAASVADTVIGRVSEGGDKFSISFATFCAGVTNVTLCCAGGFCAFNYYVAMIVELIFADYHP